jgi:hypothetical protein
MKKSHYLQLALALILINYIFFTSTAVGVEYNLGISQDDNLIWTIEELDDDRYEDIFINEADFDEGDQRKVEIDKIEETNSKWKISYYSWDYTDKTDDFSSEADDYKTKKVYKDPEDQADVIYDMETFAKMWIVPNPYLTYLEELKKEHDNDFFDVSVDDETITMKPALENAEYEIQISYGGDGIAEKIEYIDDNGDTFLKIVEIEEAIPGYDIALILGFIILGGIVGIFLWKKKLNFSY